MSDGCLVLISSLSTDQIQVVNSRRMLDSLTGMKIQFETLDGSVPENKERRDECFAISGQRGKYPQCFLTGEGPMRFIGVWEDVESLMECDSIPEEVLAANPEIKTFAKVGIYA
ncbi:hypothetical protein B484DRAFT_455817 [Ochromonadaceae sp. CCMP2298]|nr:hypothetical protein B484DRAFT_455817 [Ochromonadaceae sp. CCMP2298]